jgi:hypothetical protein
VPAHAPLRERFLADTPEARRLVAAVLYVVFVPLASSVEVAHGAVGRHAVLFAAASAFLALQLVLCLVLARLGDRVSLFLVFAVPATFAAYVSAAPAAGDALWPCLVLPVAWTAVFLPTRLVALSVLLNGAATGWQLSGQPLGWSDAVAVAIRVLTLVVMAVIVHGLVSTLRRTRDHAQAAEQALREVERRRDEVLSELLRMQDAQRSHIATEPHVRAVQRRDQRETRARSGERRREPTREPPVCVKERRPKAARDAQREARLRSDE